jgi:hypothetical protein
VLRVRGFVRELLSSLNCSLDQRRGRERRGGLTGEGEDGGAPRIVLGRGEEGSGRGRCGEGGARGDLFIGARGKGSGGAWRAPVRCTTPALMPHSAADETPWWGGTGQGHWSSGEDGAVSNSSCAARGRRWRGWRSVVREEDDTADRWDRSASEGKRASERGWRVGLACQREGARGARGRLRVRAGRLMGRRGMMRGRGEERWPRHGPELAQQGGELFFFFFLFSITHFIFVSFLFEQNYLVDDLGVGK